MAGVKQDYDGTLAILTLDEPGTLNAMTPELMGNLTDAIGETTDNPAIRALVLTGSGRGFCSGHNLNISLEGDVVSYLMQYYWPAFKALRECRVPVVVAVNGVAAGGGFGLALSGDMIVASRSASFIQIFSRIGQVPDMGSTWLLPRLIGQQRALELMLLNQPLSAEKARDWGIVHEVFNETDIMNGALALARRLAEGPTRALIATRQLLDHSSSSTYASQFRYELEVQAEIRGSADSVEGVVAFIEKRKARFIGR